MFLDNAMERINRLILQGGRTGMTENQFFAAEIKEWKNSQRRKDQVMGDLYYEGQHDILQRQRTIIGENGQLQVVTNLPNNRLIDNQYAYVDWKSSGTLSLTASLPLTGGTNGTVADSDYQTYLDQAEAYTFNAMGCTESKATITALFAAFAKRMRDDVGKKFQVVLFRKLADYEGVVSVKNGLTSDKTSTALIPWVTGVIGGTAVNKSATNMTYDGEYDVDTDFTQTQLENGIKEGSFMFHRVDEAVCVLTDINSFISITDEKSSDFSSNQTIRVLDQIANDIAVLFGKKYLGKVPNDAAGRISLWNDIVKHHTELQDIRAIENFSGENVTVEKGDTKKSVVVTDYVTPVNAMEQLYMTVYVQ